MIYCMKCYVDFGSLFLYILNISCGFSFICERPVKDPLSRLVIEKVMECMLKPFSQVCIL